MEAIHPALTLRVIEQGIWNRFVVFSDTLAPDLQILLFLLPRGPVKRLLLLSCFFFLCYFDLSAVEANTHADSEKIRSTQVTPFVFEPTSRQQMLGRIPGVTLRFSPSDVHMQRSPGKESFRIHFQGSTGHARLEGRERMPSETHYLIGNRSAEWRTHVANFGRIRYNGLYPGIDAVFYGNADRLEHDFIVSPGADYQQISMRFSSRAHASVDRNGDLIIDLPDGEVRMHRPTIYQDGSTGREYVDGGFRVRRDGEIGFRVGRYDTSRALVIDPILSFSTYLASTFSEENFIATDSAGATYVSGTGELGYPVTPRAFAGCSLCASNQVVTYIS
jgi:hypothetical protein